MKTSARFLWVFILLGITSEVSAQRGHGSLYSYFGVGIFTYDNLGMARRIGGVGSAVRSPYFLNTVNPASQNSIEVPFTFLLDGEMSYQYQTIQTQTEAISNNFSNMNYFQFWFRVAPKSTLSFGLSPISIQDYSFSDIVSFEGGSERYARIYKGWGNTNKVYLNFASSLGKRFSFGIRPSFVFLNTQKESVYLNSNEDGFMSETTVNASGFGLETGIQWDVFSNSKHKLTWGLNSQNFSSVTGVGFEKISTYLKGETLYESEEESISFYIPHSIRSGLAFQSPKWLFSGDFLYGFKSETLQNNITNQVYSMGMEFLPGYFSPNFLNTMSFSLGGSYDTGAIQIEGKRVESFTVNTSVGIPLNRASRVFLGYQYRKTGALDILADEAVHSISLQFNFGDRWFQKYNFD